MQQPSIGILRGMENSFPDALIDRINSLQDTVTAGFLSIGGIIDEHIPQSAVIIDRISHDIPQGELGGYANSPPFQQLSNPQT